MQLDGQHLLFEECLLDLTYLYNLNVTKTSKSRLLLDYMFVWSDYYIRVMQISEGPSSTLAVKKHNAFSVAFFVAFSKLEGCCKPSFENTLSNSKWTIEWSFENLEQDTVGNLNSRAQLFEGRLALNPGLNLTLVSFSCAQKHFLGEFHLLFLELPIVNL